MSGHLIHHLLDASADARSEAAAVVDVDRSITYEELDRRSSQLACVLWEEGIRPGDRVGLYLEKSIEAVIGIYGALKVGAAYVPLDSEAPTARLGYIAKDCAVSCLLTTRRNQAGWGQMTQAGARIPAIVFLDGEPDEGADRPSGTRLIGSSALEGQPSQAPATSTTEDDLAYILYTSGSTGNPKGVMLSHLNGLAFVDWAVEEFGVNSADRLSNHAPLHFDLSVFDLFAAASVGAPVILAPPKISVFPMDLRWFIERNEITIWYSVPSILSTLALRGGLRGGALPRLRRILFAGEVFPTKYLRMLMEQLPHVRFANLYGPTETNVCTWYEVPPLSLDQTEPIPIGRAIAGVEAFAMKEDGGGAGVHEEGELCVRGPTVMRGYWGDSDRTSRMLVSDPRGGPRGGLVYRTGDLVLDPGDGNFVFLGRRDSQIKSRGYRIELGEIETALYAHPSVLECAVVAIPDELITNRIKAYVVARDATGQAALLDHCAALIPRYMLPEHLELVAALPRTSTGKVDRVALTRSVTEMG